MDSRSLEQRISDAVDRAESRLDKTGDCWLWPGGTARGYGFVHVRRGGGAVTGCQSVYIHRAMYERYVGPIPEGLQLDHLCRVRNCANPTHLEVVTCAENIQRAAALITHCPQGHLYSEENTYYRKDGRGGRNCRECARSNLRRYKEKRQC